MMQIRNSILLSIFSGLLLLSAWPANGFAPLLFIAWVPLLAVEDHCKTYSGWKIFGLSLFAFLIWNVFTTWWVYFASAEGAYLAIGLNSIFMGIVFTCFHYTKTVLGARKGYIALVLYWIAFEYMHLNWDVSWPWLTLGNGFSAWHKWIQWYEYTGVFGGSLWILVVNIFLYRLITVFSSTDKKKILLYGLGISSLIAIPAALSIHSYSQYKEKEDPVSITVLQPNIDPYHEKFSVSVKEQLHNILDLAAQNTDNTTQYIVAPETALPEAIWESEIDSHPSVIAIREFLTHYPKAEFVTGLSSFKMFLPGDKKSETARPYQKTELFFDAFNTAMQIDVNGKIQLYHKSKLVPGVEKIPYPAIFGVFEQYAIDLGGTSGSLGTQKERTVFSSSINSASPAPVICYESIYGDFTTGYILKGADLIFIITNDGWWDDTPGYKQHLLYGRLRAIEMRRSIARSANTGISCFINQRGDILQQTKWWKKTAIRGVLNKNNELTYYAKSGDTIGRVFSFLGVFLFLTTRIRKFFSGRKKIFLNN